MKKQTVEEWLKAGNVIKKATTRKAQGYKLKTKFRAMNHMNSKKESHVWWVEDKENTLQT